VLDLKSLLLKFFRKKRLVWSDFADEGDTWAQAFPFNVWYIGRKEPIYYAYESYFLSDVEEYTFKAPAILKKIDAIDKAYLQDVEVIQQDGYFYCDRVKFKAPYTGVIEVFYPSGVFGSEGVVRFHRVEFSVLVKGNVQDCLVDDGDNYVDLQSEFEVRLGGGVLNIFVQ